MTDNSKKISEQEAEIKDVQLQSELMRTAYFQLKEKASALEKAERTLADDRAYLISIINSIADPIFVKDENFKFILVNDGLCRMLGLERDKIIGHTLVEALPAEEIAVFLKNDRQVLATGQENISEEFLTGVDKKTLTIVTKKTRYIDKQGARFVVGVIRDITEAKQEEQKLKESEIRHRAILETAMDGFWVMDMEGRILEVNESYVKMSGYSQEELLKMKVSDLEVVEDAQVTAEHMRKVKEAGEAFFETKHRHKDGSIFEVEISVQYKDFGGGCFVIFLHDITLRKQAETLMEKSEKESKKMIQYMVDRELRMTELKKENARLKGAKAESSDIEDAEK